MGTISSGVRAVDVGASMSKLTVRAAARIDELEDISAQVSNFLRKHALGGEPTERLLLMLSELFANAVGYGTADVGQPEISVELSVTDDRVSATLVDNGVAFDPWTESDLPDLDSGVDERPIGGLGALHRQEPRRRHRL